MPSSRPDLSVEDIEKNTKIRREYLEALENDQYHQLPSGTYARGFIKNYANYLNLSEKTLLSVFRRDFTENEQGQIIPRSMVKPISANKFIWTPKYTLLVVKIL